MDSAITDTLGVLSPVQILWLESQRLRAETSASLSLYLTRVAAFEAMVALARSNLRAASASSRSVL